MGKNRDVVQARSLEKRLNGKHKKDKNKKNLNNQQTQYSQTDSQSDFFFVVDYSNGNGAIDRYFNPRKLIAKTAGNFFRNSCNIVNDETIERLINSEKIEIENIDYNNRLLNLNTEFAHVNGNYKKGKTFYSKDTKYYAIKYKIDDITKYDVVAISVLNHQDIKSVCLTYLPKGDINKSIFIARICQHGNIHTSSDGSLIKPGLTHFHKASEKYYRYAMNKYKNETPSKLSNAFAHPDAEYFEQMDNIENMIETSKNVFNITDKKIDLREPICENRSFLKELGQQLKLVMQNSEKIDDDLYIDLCDVENSEDKNYEKTDIKEKSL